MNILNRTPSLNPAFKALQRLKQLLNNSRAITKQAGRYGRLQKSIWTEVCRIVTIFEHGLTNLEQDIKNGVFYDEEGLQQFQANFADAVEISKRWLRVTAHTRPTNHSQRILDALNDLDEGLKLVIQYVQKQSQKYRQEEEDQQFRDLIPLWDAIRSKDRKVSKDLTLKQLAEWVSGIQDVDEVMPNDRKQIELLVKLYLLMKIPGQRYELWYQAWVDKRHKVRLFELTGFPDNDDILMGLQMAGGNKQIYLATKNPSWRITWKFNHQFTRI